ncbi:hypothetical protein BT69DRAFT_1341540 [Atractiella rhizophila]|nr:hypothetical protein BT69DRAFT_1341540 [Atractiella rhizophila]
MTRPDMITSIECHSGFTAEFVLQSLLSLPAVEQLSLGTCSIPVLVSPAQTSLRHLSIDAGWTDLCFGHYPGDVEWECSFSLVRTFAATLQSVRIRHYFGLREGLHREHPPFQYPNLKRFHICYIQPESQREKEWSADVKEYLLDQLRLIIGEFCVCPLEVFGFSESYSFDARASAGLWILPTASAENEEEFQAPVASNRSETTPAFVAYFIAKKRKEGYLMNIKRVDLGQSTFDCLTRTTQGVMYSGELAKLGIVTRRGCREE